MISRSTAIVLAFIAAFPAYAADDGAAGHFVAFACGTVPRPLSVELVVPDDTKDNVKLGQALEGLLRKDGIGVAKASVVKLTLETEIVREAERHRSHDLGEITHSPTTDPNISDTTQTEVRVNLWSSRRDSVLTGRQDEVLAQGVDELRLTVKMNDKSNGRCLWQGEIDYSLKGYDPWRAAELLLPTMTAGFGRSVQNEPVTIEEPLPVARTPQQ